MRSLYLLLLSCILIGAGCSSSKISNTSKTKETNIVQNIQHIIPTTTQQQNLLASSTINLTTTTTSTSSSISTLATSSLETNTIKQFLIYANNAEFTPSSLTVQKGDLVKLQILSHDDSFIFSFPSFNIHKPILPGEKTDIVFKVKRSGSYSFYCSKSCMSENMSGVLFVRE